MKSLELVSLRLLLGCFLIIRTLPLAAQVSDASPELVNEIMREAVVMAEKGQIGDAIELLERIRHSSENEGRDQSPRVAGFLAALYLERNQPQDAYELILPFAETSVDPALLFNAGRAALALGRIEQGEQWLARSTRIAPVSPAARILGLRRAQQGRLVDAYRLLRPWALQYPDDEAARLAAAYLALRLERSSEAERLLSDLPQDHPRVRLLWGELLLQQEDPRGAIAILSPLAAVAVDLPPELELDRRRTLAAAHLSLGNPEEALSQIQNVPIETAEDALLHARARLRTGEAPSAATILAPHATALLEGTTDSIPIEQLGLAAEIAREYGRAMIETGQLEDAARVLELAIDLEPWSGEIPEILAQRVETETLQALSRSLDAKRSQQIFNLAAAKDDATASALLDAQRWLVEGKPERTLEIARREAELAPGDLRPQFIEVQALLSMGRLDEAGEAADRTLEISPENADALYQKGLIQMMKGDTEAAEISLRRSLDAAPDHTAAMNDLALLLIQQGELEEGRLLLERILLLQPEHETAKELLERLTSSS